MQGTHRRRRPVLNLADPDGNPVDPRWRWGPGLGPFETGPEGLEGFLGAHLALAHLHRQAAKRGLQRPQDLFVTVRTRFRPGRRGWPHHRRFQATEGGTHRAIEAGEGFARSRLSAVQPVGEAVKDLGKPA